MIAIISHVQRSIVVACSVVGLLLCGMASGSTAGTMSPLSPNQVAVGGDIGRRIELTVNGNMLKLNLDKDFLGPLKDKKGVYIGVGILLDVASQLAATLNDERVKAIRDRVAKELLAAQEADGYIGYKPPADRVWQLFDPDEIAQILIGLSSHHRATGDAASLAAARKLADYLIRTIRSDPARAKAGAADILTWICLDHALLDVQEASGERSYAEFCIRDRQLPEWSGPIVFGRWGAIGGHAYGHLAKCYGQLRLHRLTADQRLLGPTRRLMDFLTRGEGMAVTGEVGMFECWHNSQEGTLGLGETCATTYLLYVLNELLQLDRTAVHGDLMERMIYNALFASQSPDGRKIRYYTPMEGPRMYFPQDTFCCPNNYRRAIALLPQLIYYRVDDGVAVNLYTASSAAATLENGVTVKLRQETDYPSSGQVALHVETNRPASFPLWLRIPAWCSKPSVTVGGQPIAQQMNPGQFLVLKREWKNGDQVRLDLPMQWRWIKGRQAQAGRVALARGPLVFCLNPSRYKELVGANLRQLWIFPETLQQPLKDEKGRPGGLKARVGVWRSMNDLDLLPQVPNLNLDLTEFTDAGGEMTYFGVANPHDPRFVDDELLTGRRKP